MTDSLSTPQIEALAAEIGENIYIDVAKWHLYLADAHLHTFLAERVASLLVEDNLSEKTVTEILRQIPVTLGGGNLEVSLLNLLPSSVQSDLLNLLKNYQENL